ncbi:MAG TPA: formate dehydrogenase accessory sulfurtransferase FdhD [Spirochaetales bacterium]|nr:formate dehydrogenase accessory sulfurtransferase FdhD [Spirochaetales bacterium]HPG85911.1 formate dehydrogenase accessory sulfurtransferase FdhD [Spirochaetales bacterium]HPM72429.1 formate dehydrogenase accessory sulfurtransferase FdhD [Spirochaetales bacterium]HQO66211.1 formate dehydrogenase accessory sulfurtransferase FdhD [Spirochaetales bacterium]
MHEYKLADETPVELVANGERVAILLCTPINLDDLAVGHLFSRGMLRDRAKVLAVGACADLRTMSVVAPGGVGPDRYGLGTVMATGAGPAAVRADASGLRTVGSGLGVGMNELKAWARAMFEAAAIYRQSGGVHCAALVTRPSADGAPYFVVREDVGRHNAVDKVLGRGFMDGVDFSSACALTSGRVAADMILKIISAGIPVIVSRSIPTTTAAELADAAGVTIVGRIGDQSPVVYTRPERVV